MAAGTEAAPLLEPWPDAAGIGIGLPPFDRLETPSLEEALELAIDGRREAAVAIATDPRPATFENTVEALEVGAMPLARLENLLRHLASTGSGEELQALHERMTPRLAALEDEIAGQRNLLERIGAVAKQECLTAEQRRLAEVLRDRLRLQGAGLEPEVRELVASLDEALRYDRIFSLTLEYLATAIVDLRLHQLADGRAIDAMAVEEEVLSELGVPAAVEPLLRVPHAMHTFSEAYLAAIYSYLWADVLAAQAAGEFERAPRGLWDTRVADRYPATTLEAGSTAPAAELFRALIDREPSPSALLDRFGL